jgi:hypothetical protein
VSGSSDRGPDSPGSGSRRGASGSPSTALWCAVSTPPLALSASPAVGCVPPWPATDPLRRLGGRSPAFADVDGATGRAGAPPSSGGAYRGSRSTSACTRSGSTASSWFGSPGGGESCGCAVAAGGSELTALSVKPALSDAGSSVSGSPTPRSPVSGVAGAAESPGSPASSCTPGASDGLALSLGRSPPAGARSRSRTGGSAVGGAGSTESSSGASSQLAASSRGGAGDSDEPRRGSVPAGAVSSAASPVGSARRSGKAPRARGSSAGSPDSSSSTSARESSGSRRGGPNRGPREGFTSPKRPCSRAASR